MPSKNKKARRKSPFAQLLSLFPSEKQQQRDAELEEQSAARITKKKVKAALASITPAMWKAREQYETEAWHGFMQQDATSKLKFVPAHYGRMLDFLGVIDPEWILSTDSRKQQEADGGKSGWMQPKGDNWLGRPCSAATDEASCETGGRSSAKSGLGARCKWTKGLNLLVTEFGGSCALSEEYVTDLAQRLASSRRMVPGIAVRAVLLEQAQRLLLSDKDNREVDCAELLVVAFQLHRVSYCDLLAAIYALHRLGSARARRPQLLNYIDSMHQRHRPLAQRIQDIDAIVGGPLRTTATASSKSSSNPKRARRGTGLKATAKVAAGVMAMSMVRGAAAADGVANQIQVHADNYQLAEVDPTAAYLMHRPDGKYEMRFGNVATDEGGALMPMQGLPALSVAWRAFMENEGLAANALVARYYATTGSGMSHETALSYVRQLDAEHRQFLEDIRGKALDDFRSSKGGKIKSVDAYVNDFTRTNVFATVSLFTSGEMSSFNTSEASRTVLAHACVVSMAADDPLARMALLLLHEESTFQSGLVAQVSAMLLSLFALENINVGLIDQKSATHHLLTRIGNPAARRGQDLSTLVGQLINVTPATLKDVVQERMDFAMETLKSTDAGKQIFNDLAPNGVEKDRAEAFKRAFLDSDPVGRAKTMDDAVRVGYAQLTKGAQHGVRESVTLAHYMNSLSGIADQIAKGGDAKALTSAIVEGESLFTEAKLAAAKQLGIKLSEFSLNEGTMKFCMEEAARQIAAKSKVVHLALRANNVLNNPREPVGSLQGWLIWGAKSARHYDLLYELGEHWTNVGIAAGIVTPLIGLLVLVLFFARGSKLSGKVSPTGGVQVDAQFGAGGNDNNANIERIEGRVVDIAERLPLREREVALQAAAFMRGARSVGDNDDVYFVEENLKGGRQVAKSVFQFVILRGNQLVQVDEKILTLSRNEWANHEGVEMRRVGSIVSKGGRDKLLQAMARVRTAQREGRL